MSSICGADTVPRRVTVRGLPADAQRESDEKATAFVPRNLRSIRQEDYVSQPVAKAAAIPSDWRKSPKLGKTIMKAPGRSGAQTFIAHPT